MSLASTPEEASSKRLEIRLLGNFEARLSGKVITSFESIKVRLLLAYLAAEANRPHSRMRLAGLLWPDWPEEAAQKNLRHSLYSLRKTLEGLSCLEADRQWINFHLGGDCRVDVAELEKGLAYSQGGKTSDGQLAMAEQAANPLRLAVENYRGLFLEGFSLDDSPELEAWILNRREHYTQQILRALILLADWHEQAREYAEAEAYTRRQLEIEPWRELTHQQLMRLLAFQDQRVLALTQYESLKRELKNELEVEPSTATTLLYEQIRDRGLSDPDSRPESQFASRIGRENGKPRHNLPILLTSFIGREMELLGIKLILNVDKARLVTLTGPGGTGKTRLALKVAADLLEAFKDGVWLVDLAPLAEPALVLQSAAVALGIRQVPGKEIPSVLSEHLRSRQLLLILDNCEHLVEACASLASILLQTCPDLQILATSREILGMSGEVPFHVPTLSVPDPLQSLPLKHLTQFEAVRLFVERATQALPRFMLTSENALGIARICSRLDGIPLAIELAAARIRLMSVEQIASRLEDAFSLLIGGSRTELPRHQTLKALIDWSYDLLSQPERLLLGRLSTFAGGWTLEAAEEVCGGDGQLAVLPLMGQLVDKSLVLVRQEDRPEARYHLLETIRQYALEKAIEMGEVETTRNRHLDYYLKLARQAAPHLRSRDQATWLDGLESEVDNLRAALDWSLSASLQDGLDLGAELLWFWHIRGRGIEGIHWLERLLTTDQQTHQDDVPGPDQRLTRANAMLAMSFLLALQNQVERSRGYLVESLESFRELGKPGRKGLAFALIRLGDITEDINQALALYEKGLDLSRQLGDQFLVAEGLQGVGGRLTTQGKHVEAKAVLEEDLVLRKELGDLDGEGTALNMLGFLAQLQGDYAHARRLFEASLACYQSVNNFRYCYYLLFNLAYLACLMEDYPEATRRCEQALAMGHDSVLPTLIVNVVSFMGVIAWSQGDYELAKQKGQEALQIGQEMGDTRLLVASYYILGRIALSQGDYPEAEVNLRCLIELTQDIDLDQGSLSSGLLSLAMLARRKGRLNLALKLYSAAEHFGNWVDHLTLPVDRFERQAELASLRLELGEEAFATAWAEGQAMTQEQVSVCVQQALE